MVQYSFTSTETITLVGTDSPGRPPRLSYSSCTVCTCSLHCSCLLYAPDGHGGEKERVKNGMVDPDWNVSVVDIHLRKLCVYCLGHAGVKGNDRADRLAGKATLTRGLCRGRSEVLRSLRHYLRAQRQGYHIPSIAWRR